MQMAITRQFGALAIGALLLSVAQVAAQNSKSEHEAAQHDHAHADDHAHEPKDDIYRGYFKDSQIEERPLSDWEGDWQSVYPYLLDGTLAPVMQHKAEHGNKSAEEYREYYETGYETDVDRITIDGDIVTFYRNGDAVEGHYTADGHEILTYKKGNRGVRYIFEKTKGDEAAPQFIQFSDHAIAPVKAGHYHLYWGDDRAGLLDEITNWPTYYPSALSGEEIVNEMMAH